MGSQPVVEFQRAALAFGRRWLWTDLEFTVQPGEFLAVLGPNGAGKSTLLKVLLGLLTLTSGTVRVRGATPDRGSRLLGYVPQQRGFDTDLGARGRDLVALGADGHRFGRPWSSKSTRELVDAAIAAVGAGTYAEAPIGRLSGGEQQRLRIAQALVGDPKLLLCDEPLLSLDLLHQRGVIELIDTRRRVADTAVLMVTHEINPVLPILDRILYLVDGRWAIGTPDEVMTSERLSDLYQTEIDVIRVRGRIIVVGAANSIASDFTGHDQTHEHNSSRI